MFIPFRLIKEGVKGVLRVLAGNGISGVDNFIWLLKIGRLIMAIMGVLRWPWKKIARVLYYVLKAFFEALTENEKEKLTKGPGGNQK